MQISDRRGVRKLQRFPICVVSKYLQCIVWLRQRSRVMDRQMDGQNYDSQDCASIAASHGKNSLREYLIYY